VAGGVLGISIHLTGYRHLIHSPQLRHSRQHIQQSLSINRDQIIDSGAFKKSTKMADLITTQLLIDNKVPRGGNKSVL